MPPILVSGFEPFGGERINPCVDVLANLPKEIAGCAVERLLMPTTFANSIARLTDSVNRLQPSCIVCLGQAGGRAAISIERVALNLDDASIPDNAGAEPSDRPIVAGGPVAYWSTLPVRAIVSALAERGIPASLSYSAGTYVCNHVFYGLMHHLALQRGTVPAGFVHIPYLPEQAARHPGRPIMSLDLLLRGIVTVVETTLRAAM